MCDVFFHSFFLIFFFLVSFFFFFFFNDTATTEIYTLSLHDALPMLAFIALVAAALYATVAPMVFALLATEVDADRRSQTLNLVYLPLYVGGIVGLVIASQVVKAGLAAPFLLAAVVYLGGGLLIAAQFRVGGAGSTGVGGRGAADREAGLAEGAAEGTAPP